MQITRLSSVAFVFRCNKISQIESMRYVKKKSNETRKKKLYFCYVDETLNFFLLIEEWKSEHVTFTKVHKIPQKIDWARLQKQNQCH